MNYGVDYAQLLKDIEDGWNPSEIWASMKEVILNTVTELSLIVSEERNVIIARCKQQPTLQVKKSALVDGYEIVVVICPFGHYSYNGYVMVKGISVMIRDNMWNLSLKEVVEVHNMVRSITREYIRKSLESSLINGGE